MIMCVYVGGLRFYITREKEALNYLVGKQRKMNKYV